MTLPHGFEVTLDRSTRVLDGGRVLLGGSPVRLVRLGARARPLLSGRTVRVRDAAGAVLADRLLETGLAHPAVHALPPHAGPDGGEEPSCTYVIPVRDRPRELARLLAGLPERSPVVVVDDASRRPGLVAAVAAEHGARLLPLTANVGPAGARNAGLRLVTTPYVVFVDSDIVLPRATVPTLLRHFADPRVAMAVPRITGLATPASSGWLGRYERIRSSLDLGAEPAPVRPGTPVSWVPSACVVARVDALGDGFDTRLRVGEDVDLCWRLVRDGRRVRYEPSVEAAHEHRVALRDWFRRKAVYGTGAHPLAERHPRNIAPAVLAPWSAGLVVALAAQRRWSLPVAAGLCTVAAARIADTLRGTGQPVRHAARLTAGGAVSAVAQGSALLTRHWWPLTVLGCLASSRVRRATAVAAVLDIALERRWDEAGLDPLRYGIARRLDDLAYGSGVWISAVKGRSTAALRPRIVPARTSARHQPRRGPRAGAGVPRPPAPGARDPRAPDGRR
ncbi:mycofactocin biosynthesis glycosyltransferase MftF [Streptomyces viridosporus]|uniref:mycofactocin biosynthesis glycosyltransferase MftF n=1 Tax=Streptomyces viridosporus TaxID=67581 RepID=UPI0009BF698E|nr:mycofactocin biosynthesis glycosyltransferase MftF [Streptomyces viridosporus]